MSRTESLYVELLEAFATDLRSKRKRLIFVSVNNDLNSFAKIRAGVQALHARNLLAYLPVEPWFERMANISSPEGRLRGEKAHQVIGARLAEYIQGFERAASAE